MIPKGMSSTEARESLARIAQEARDKWAGIPHPGSVIDDYIAGAWAKLCGKEAPELITKPADVPRSPSVVVTPVVDVGVKEVGATSERTEFEEIAHPEGVGEWVEETPPVTSEVVTDAIKEAVAEASGE